MHHPTSRSHVRWIRRISLIGLVVAIVIVIALPDETPELLKNRAFVYGETVGAVAPSGSLLALGHDEGWNPGSLVRMAPQLFRRVDERDPSHSVAVIEIAPGRMEAALAETRARREVHFAYPVYHLGDPKVPGSRHILTDELLVGMRAGAGTAAMATASASLALPATPITWSADTYLLKVKKGVDALDLANELAVRGDVAFAHPNWLRKLTTREQVPNDPLFGNQWHLKNTGQGSGVVGADIKATHAWSMANGSGRVIAVIDTGVDFGMSDILQTTVGYNPVTGPGVSAADDIATHGTACAGVAAATGNNGTLLTGAAPGAVVMPIRLLTSIGYGTPLEEANCFIYAADNGADVISNSWGPDGIPFLLPTIVQNAFIYAVTTGRGGKGCPIFWASGNGNEDIATDQYVSSTYTIAVGSTTNFDVRASYSDFGAALALVAPSSGGSRNINTTIPNNTYTSNFGGTSASAPQAAGVAAMMLQVNPNLTWTQVRTLLTQTADKIQPALAAYNNQGHSLTYGYGRLNAFNAVAAALASAGAPTNLSVWTMGFGDITISMSGMDPNAEWVLGASLQIYNPPGSGPFLGLGFDAIQTMLAPIGFIPFHSLASPAGTFAWSQPGGIPPGITVQLRVVEFAPGGGLRASNVVQVVF